MIITHCTLEEQQGLLGPGHTEAHVIYDNGDREKLFSYYADELTFTVEEIVGLTRTEALALWQKRDADHLRS